MPAARYAVISNSNNGFRDHRPKVAAHRDHRVVVIDRRTPGSSTVLAASSRCTPPPAAPIAISRSAAFSSIARTTFSTGESGRSHTPRELVLLCTSACGMVALGTRWGLPGGDASRHRVTRGT